MGKSIKPEQSTGRDGGIYQGVGPCAHAPFPPKG